MSELVSKDTFTKSVIDRVESIKNNEGIAFPPGYSVPNAINSAYLKLMEIKTSNKEPVLKACSRVSITNALFDMVIQGLSPAKNQCYFIPYGDSLTLQRSYFGTVAAIKRLKDVKNVYAEIIYAGDVFEYEIDIETGLKKIVKHEQSFENINPDKIMGAYAVITRESGPNFVEVMNIDQIKKSWNMGQMKGGSSAHKNFADQMTKRTVINRACKMFVNTSDDSDIIIEAINKTTENEYKNFIDVSEEVKKEIAENGNKELIIPPVTPPENPENNSENNSNVNEEPLF